MARIVLLAICAVIAGPSRAGAQAPALDGFVVGLGWDLSAVLFADQAERILGGTESGVGWGYRLRLGYRHETVSVGMGVEATQVVTGGGNVLSALAMPFELEMGSPVPVGSIVPGVLVGYIRYGVGYHDVPGSRIPGAWALPDETYEVGFIANGFRLGASFGVPPSNHFLMEVRPVADFLPFGHLELRGEGETDLDDPGWSRRYAVASVLSWVF